MTDGKLSENKTVKFLEDPKTGIQERQRHQNVETQAGLSNRKLGKLDEIKTEDSDG